MFKTDQKGITAIMFAMFFVIVISLITIGYSTLARKDQQSALDNNLSNKGQYAAETIVNSVQSYIRSVSDPTLIVDDNQCGWYPVEYKSFKPNFGPDSGVDATCITWKASPKTINFDVREGSSFSFENTNSAVSDSMKFIWRQSGAGLGGTYGATTSNTLPTINRNNNAVLRITTSDDMSPNGEKVFYLAPTTSGSVTAAYSTAGVLNAQCTVSPPAPTTCELLVTGIGAGKYVNVQTIGGSANITFQDISNTGVPKDIKGSMAFVDANIKINNSYTKRVQAYIPLKGSTWQPTAAAFANTLCKDIKVDGNNTSGITSGVVCPN